MVPLDVVVGSIGTIDMPHYLGQVAMRRPPAC